jgi:spermidine synthase
MSLEINQTRPISSGTTALAGFFALSLFSSAALLFWVQPLIAKMLLPFLGGAPSVWNTCMVFFQALLLAGYGYVLILSRFFSIKRQATIHLFLLIAAAIVLPFTLPNNRLAAIPTNGSPVWWLLLTLFITSGAPFFVLSATAPLLQNWFARSEHKSAKDPYFLYAVSNAGSMLALLAFPFLLEPSLAIRTQNRIWAIGYIVLVASIICCIALLKTTERPDILTVSAEHSIATRDRLFWILLAFIPSSLMLGITTYIATDVASVPLVWIIPLALYLLTFILAFSNRQLLHVSLTSKLLPLSIVGLGGLMIFKPPISAWAIIGLHLIVFFIAALLSHGRLALMRPHVRHLPEYYLWIATGGVLGGIFNALIAPNIFSTALEYPAVIVLACLIRTSSQPDSQPNKLWRTAFPALVLVLTVALSVLALRLSTPIRVQDGIALFVPLVFCYVVTLRRPVMFAFGLAAFLLGSTPYLNASTQTITTHRNFFGVWRVTDSNTEEFRRLWHGSTVHGVQFKDTDRKCEPTSYYSKNGPVGQIFEVSNARKSVKTVAVTGLGAGSLGTYSLPDQKWDFYEIDPAIVKIANDPQYFSFLSDCTSASHRMILGDARLRLRDAEDHQYDLILMDAFSSDSVPAHLLTSEALDLYLTKLADNGILVFHISNRYLDLEPLLSGLANSKNLKARLRRDQERTVIGRYPSIWVVFARDDKGLGSLIEDQRWRQLNGNIVWTDDSSNILSLLK